jgi:hypothetical protein
MQARVARHWSALAFAASVVFPRLPLPADDGSRGMSGLRSEGSRRRAAPNLVTQGIRP